MGSFMDHNESRLGTRRKKFSNCISSKVDTVCHHVSLVLTRLQVAVIQKTTKECQGFAHGYTVTKQGESTNTPPPMRSVYCQWESGCDRFNELLYSIKGFKTYGWRFAFVSCFIRMTVVNAWVLHSALHDSDVTLKQYKIWL